MLKYFQYLLLTVFNYLFNVNARLKQNDLEELKNILILDLFM